MFGTAGSERGAACPGSALLSQGGRVRCWVKSQTSEPSFQSSSAGGEKAHFSSCLHLSQPEEQMSLSSPGHLLNAPPEAPQAFSSVHPEDSFENDTEKG